VTITCSVFVAVSLDGFIARANGDIDWLTNASAASGGEDYGYREFFDSVDALIIGRNTYAAALGFAEWPYLGKRVVVLSSQSSDVLREPLMDIEILSGSPVDVLHRLSDAGAAHVYVDGGRTIQGFLKAGLIRDMTITRIPILLGAGIPLFGPLDRDIQVRHLGTKTYPSGFVQSKYEVAVSA